MASSRDFVSKSTADQVETLFEKEFQKYLERPEIVRKLQAGEALEYDFNLDSLVAAVKKSVPSASDTTKKEVQEDHVNFETWLKTTDWAYEGKPVSSKIRKEKMPKSETGAASTRSPPSDGKQDQQAQDEVLINGFRKLFL
jgi:hypothetical protein